MASLPTFGCEEMDDFEKKKLELLRPLMFEVGAAMLDCQGMEYGIALLLFHFSRLGIKGLSLQDTSRILDNQDKKTAGQLIRMLKKHVTVSAGIEDALAEGLHARNVIVHRVLIDNIEMFPKPESRAKLIKEIRVLRRKVRAADKSLSPFIKAFSAALDGIEINQLEIEVKALFS
jgi:hypothetical protein